LPGQRAEKKNAGKTKQEVKSHIEYFNYFSAGSRLNFRLYFHCPIWKFAVYICEQMDICFALHLLWNWISWGFPWQLLLLFVLFPLFFCLCAWCTTWRMGNLFAICRGWLEKWNEIKCSRLRNWEEEFGKNLFFRAFCSNFRIEHPLSGLIIIYV